MEGELEAYLLLPNYHLQSRKLRLHDLPKEVTQQETEPGKKLGFPGLESSLFPSFSLSY